MKPSIFFPYFGAKFQRGHAYPAPRHDLVIEPFAGAAGYSVRHAVERALLIDASEYVCGAWDFLIRASSDEVRRLPLLSPGEDVRSLAIPDEAKHLIGFWCSPGATTPRRTLGRRGRWASASWCSFIRERIASSVDRIRKWQVIHGTYDQAPDVRATWFVDPPYVSHAHHYRHRVDHGALATWCQTRRGQVIVCETEGATWLPFEPITKVTGCTGRTTTEVAWVREDGAAC